MAFLLEAVAQNGVPRQKKGIASRADECRGGQWPSGDYPRAAAGFGGTCVNATAGRVLGSGEDVRAVPFRDRSDQRPIEVVRSRSSMRWQMNARALSLWRWRSGEISSRGTRSKRP
jgi:hypothetical protein